jgi:hypothetical protein
MGVQGLGHRHDGRLGDGVHGRGGQRRDTAVAGRGVDDVARFAAGQHPRHEGLDAVEDTPHVDRERPFPVVRVVLPHTALGARADPRVVAQDMHGTERLVRLLGERDDLLALPDVHHARVHHGPVLAQRGGGLLQGALLHIGEDDLQPVGREAPGQGEADPARGARDDGDLSLGQFHQTLPRGGPSRICRGSSYRWWM